MSAVNGLLSLSPNQATAMSSSSSSSSTMSSDAAKITANEFLTLLVTELKNQDPTANNDPKDYINQLVAVNSLQQLIAINETLISAYGTSAAYSASTSRNLQAEPSISSTASSFAAPAERVVSGNNSIPAITHAADRLSQALSGRN